MSTGIEQWWPKLEEPLREWLVNNYWSPMHRYALDQIERAGGPDPDSEWWRRERDGSRCLPQAAMQWIIRHPDGAALAKPRQPDPRAAYFRRGWPHRS